MNIIFKLKDIVSRMIFTKNPRQETIWLKKSKIIKVRMIKQEGYRRGR